MWKHVRLYAAGAVIAAAALFSLAMTPGQSAQASTAACGGSCASPSDDGSGAGEVLTISVGGSGSCSTVTAASVLAAMNALGPCYYSIALATASSASAGQDWEPMQEPGFTETGGVSLFAGAGVLSTRLSILYGSDPVVEFESVPNGVPTGLCLSATVPTTSITSPGPLPGTVGGSIGLATCGSGNTTLWIVDTGNDLDVPGYTDLISGASTNFSMPYVLTAAAGGSKTTLGLSQLSEMNAQVTPGQLWTSPFGATNDAAALKSKGMQHT